MKPPRIGSRTELMLADLRRVSMTLDQGMLRYAALDLRRSELRGIFDRLIDSGWVQEIDGTYSISVAACRVYALAEAPPVRPGQVAGPAYRPAPKPLDVTRVRIVETREGALDYQTIPTLIGNLRYLPGQLK